MIKKGILRIYRTIKKPFHSVWFLRPPKQEEDNEEDTAYGNLPIDEMAVHSNNNGDIAFTASSDGLVIESTGHGGIGLGNPNPSSPLHISTPDGIQKLIIYNEAYNPAVSIHSNGIVLFHSDTTPTHAAALLWKQFNLTAPHRKIKELTERIKELEAKLGYNGSEDYRDGSSRFEDIVDDL